VFVVVESVRLRGKREREFLPLLMNEGKMERE
jgi:hypothetical protein